MSLIFNQTQALWNRRLSNTPVDVHRMPSGSSAQVFPSFWSRSVGSCRVALFSPLSGKCSCARALGPQALAFRMMNLGRPPAAPHPRPSGLSVRLAPSLSPCWVSGRKYTQLLNCQENGEAKAGRKPSYQVVRSALWSAFLIPVVILGGERHARRIAVPLVVGPPPAPSAKSYSLQQKCSFSGSKLWGVHSGRAMNPPY